MFFLKKLVSAFLLPTTAGVALLAIGLGLLWFTRRLRAGKIVATCGFALLLLGTSRFVVNATLRPLEDQNSPLFPQAKLDEALAKAGGRPRLIVILGGGETFDPRVPAIDQLSDSALSRLVEGIRLLRQVPGTKLLLSGGYGKGENKHADCLAAAATTLGVRADEMEIDRTAWDTEQEARNLAHRIGREPFFLVTSAFHMPRSAALFRHAGTSPIPAPAHHLALDTPGVTFEEFFPSPGALEKFHTSWHEYLGIVWSKLRGRM